MSGGVRDFHGPRDTSVPRPPEVTARLDGPSRSAARPARMRCTSAARGTAFVAAGIGAVALSLSLSAASAQPTPQPGAPIRSAAETDYPPFSVVDGSGRADGFSVELLRAALEAVGRDVVFRTGPWPEVRGWLERGEVQALPLVGRTPERELLFDFTFPYMTLHGAIVVRTNTTGIRDLSDLRGRDVAVMQGDNAEEFLRREPRGIAIHTTASYEEALRQLSAGRHDAVVVQRLVALRLIEQLGLDDLRVVETPVEGFRQDFCFAVKEGDRDTLALLNEGLALVVADGTYRRLHTKWFAALELPSNRRIVVGGDENFPPFEYLDDEGRPTGFNVELTRAVARAIGMDVEIRLGPWSRIREALATGEIDAIEGMFYSPERESALDFTAPYTATHYVAVVPAGAGPPPATVAELQGKRLAVQRGDIMHDFLVENRLAARLRALDSQEEALRDVVEGRADCALVARLTALYWIRKAGWNDLSVGRRPLLAPDYCFAVPNGHKALLAQFSEGMELLERSGEYKRIHDRWLGVYLDETPSLLAALRTSARVVVPLLVALLAFLLWSWSLRRQVASRTAELRRTEEQFRSLVESAPDAIFIQRDHRFAYVNQACVELLGATAPSQVLGQAILERFHADDHAQVRERIRILNEERRPVGHVVEHMIRLDGSSVPVEVSAVPVSFEGGPGAMVFARDVTARLQAESALAESEARFRRAVQDAPFPIMIHAEDGEILTISRSWFEVTGYGPHEIATVDDWISLAYPGREEEVRPAITSTYALSARKHEGPFEIVCSDGGRRIWDFSSTPLGALGDGRRVVISMAADVTERELAERSLGEREALLRLAGRLAQLGGWTADLAARSVTWSEEVAAIHGISSTNTLPVADALAFFTPAHRERIAEAFAACARDGTSWDEEAELATADGRVVWVRTMGVAERNERGDIVRIRGALQDITERRSLEQQLLQAQKMEAVGRLAGGVAHDYNNMLNVIMGHAELALLELQPDDRRRGDLEEILAAARRSADITRQLLAFARRQTIAPRVLDLNETVAGMLKMLTRLIGEHIDLAWHPGDGLWPVKLDPVQVDQILANLCVNARDAITGGGKITIETRNQTFDASYCADHPGVSPGEYVLLAVSDDGAGMDKETLANIFEPFFTTKSGGHGTGLGLATVFGIVKQNDGFINVYSEPARGTTVRIYLLRHLDDGGESATPTAPQAVPAGRGETVLLVEDEPAILKLTARILASLSYTALAAATPAEAESLAAAHRGPIHLLVTDVVMPETDGRSLAARITAARPGLKVLYMSGYTANVIAHHGVLDEGVNFIQKPFSVEELAVKIREVLDT